MKLVCQQNVNLLNKVQSFITKKLYFTDITFSAGGNKFLEITTPTGYEFLCVVGAWTNGTVNTILIDRKGTSEWGVMLWNPSQNAFTTEIGIEVLYYKYL